MDKKWDISRLSSGERSALKRCAGVMMGSDMKAAEAFYHAAGYCEEYQEKVWFAALCMECLWRPEDMPRVRPVEEMLKDWYQDSETTESTKRRIVALLDTPWGDDGFMLGKLCALVRTMKAKDASVRPDFEKLADDLRYWNSSERFVQRRWLRVICRMNDERSEENVD